MDGNPNADDTRGTPSTALLGPGGDAVRLDGGPQDDAIDAGARTHVDASFDPTSFDLPLELPEIPGVDVRRVVGTGSSGSVFLGRIDRPEPKLVAIKVLAPALVGTVVEERFRREMKITSLIDSPFVIRVLGSGVTAGLPYLVSVWTPGRSMTGLGPMSIRFVLAVGRQMAAALDHLNRAGVVHRDVKPGNIIAARSGRRGLQTRLIDFGLARGPDDDETEGGLLSPRQSLGSPNYLAPEQLEHPGRVDGRADLYALGSTLYELLTGRPPYTGKPREVLQAKLRREPYRPLKRAEDDLPDALKEEVETLLAFDRDERPGSAGDLLDTLEDITAEEFGE